MLNNDTPSAREWNDITQYQPEIKVHQFDIRYSDSCWILLKDGKIKSARYEEVKGKGTFCYKKGLVTHWAYKDIPPPLPNGFTPQKIDYELVTS